ncbi:MAG: beta-glucosidase BglX [Bacteroidota bacterium]|nr:beta-glucosidase BglX [Bacteroidota bacterium]
MKRISFLLLCLTIACFAVAQTSPSPKMKAFIDNLMSKMTLEEKIGQLNLVTPGSDIPTGSVVSKGVEDNIRKGNVGGMFGVIGVEKIKNAQTLAVKESRLHIPLFFGSDVIHGYKTTFPIPLALSCSWDMNLIEKSARVAGTEAASDGLCWVFSPMVDIARDPRWGRIAEGGGEDAYLGSQIAKAMVNGYQNHNQFTNAAVMACVKHFALYGAAEAGRDYNTVDMSKVRMYNEYLPPYKAAVDAGTASVMSSFNEIDGIPATANQWLLTDLLRKQWGFNGFVVSDYTAVNEMIAHGMGDLQTVSALALKAGLDMDMVGEGFLTTLKKSLREGKIRQQDIDMACRRILEAKYKLGLFENPFKYLDENRAAKEVLSADKKAVAKELAEHSFVLLKNAQQTLPLQQKGTIALIGPLANDKRNMLGTWSVSGNSEYAIPVMEGIKNLVGDKVNIVYAKGANISDDPAFIKKVNVFGEEITVDQKSPEALVKEAVDAANKADVVVAVIGEAADMSGESASRSDISLPHSQQKLVEALAKTGKPLVLVVMAGRPLTIGKEVEQASSVLYTWHAGQEAGNAIADVLFGNYNPSGKLSITFPKSVGQIPIYYNHKNTGRPYNGEVFSKFKSNYLDISNQPLFPFGYGLSYTHFSYSKVELSSSVVKPNEKLQVKVMVTNNGNYDGEEVVQLYTRDMVGSITRPVKELKGFQKIFIKKGESKEVVFTLTANDLKFYNNNLKYIFEPGAFKVFVGPDSDTTNEADCTFQ